MDISLADAKARLSDLVARAEAGETIAITRRGKPVARLGAVRPLQAISLAALADISSRIRPQPDPAAAMIRAMRDGERY